MALCSCTHFSVVHFFFVLLLESVIVSFRVVLFIYLTYVAQHSCRKQASKQSGRQANECVFLMASFWFRLVHSHFVSWETCYILSNRSRYIFFQLLPRLDSFLSLYFVVLLFYSPAVPVNMLFHDIYIYIFCTFHFRSIFPFCLLHAYQQQQNTTVCCYNAAFVSEISWVWHECANARYHYPLATVKNLLDLSLLITAHEYLRQQQARTSRKRIWSHLLRRGVYLVLVYLKFIALAILYFDFFLSCFRFHILHSWSGLNQKRFCNLCVTISSVVVQCFLIGYRFRRNKHQIQLSNEEKTDKNCQTTTTTTNYAK